MIWDTGAMPDMPDPDILSADSPEVRATDCNCISLEEIETPHLLQALAYWRRLTGNRRYPARSEVTARALGPLLRRTALIRVVDGGRDYEYRIVGDAFVMAFGTSFQGKLWSEIGGQWPRLHAMVKSVYDCVVATGEAVAMRGWIERDSSTNAHVHCEFVMMPLGEDQSIVDHILFVASYAPCNHFDRPGIPS